MTFYGSNDTFMEKVNDILRNYNEKNQMSAVKKNQYLSDIDNSEQKNILSNLIHNKPLYELVKNKINNPSFRFLRLTVSPGIAKPLKTSFPVKSYTLKFIFS